MTVKPSRSSSILDNVPKPSLFNFEVLGLEIGKHTPQLRDIWILGFTNTEQHYVKFYMPRMDDMFRDGNKMIRVEHYGTISKMLSWSLDLENKWVRDKLEGIILLWVLTKKEHLLICICGRIKRNGKSTKYPRMTNPKSMDELFETRSLKTFMIGWRG